MKGKILLCIYEFPVSTSTSIRWIHFLDYLSDYGWKITVLTNKPSKAYKPLKISNKIHMVYTKPGPFYRMSRDILQPPVITENKKNITKFIKSILRFLLRKTSYLLLIPDPAIEWLLTIIKMDKSYLKDFDIVISANPPFTSHIIGYFFKKWFNKPWVIDMIDPWSISPQTDVPFWRRMLDRKIEENVIKKADKIIFTTKETMDAYYKNFSTLFKNQMEIITYGFTNTTKTTVKQSKSNLKIVYTGVFYEDIRNPSAFFEALNMLKDIEIKVIIAGPINNKYIEYVKKNNLSNKVKFLGQVSYKHTLELQKRATVLLLLGNAGGLQIPGKTYGYIGTGKPILSIKMDKNDIAAKLIKKLNRGLVVENDAQKIAKTIRKLYTLHKRNKLKKYFNLDYKEEFSWTKLSETLEYIILNIIKKNKS